MLIRVQIILCICCLFAINACKQDSILTPVNFHYTYFPLQQGVWAIYSVDSVVWDNINDSLITYSYQIKQQVDSSFIDNTGKKSWRIERYKRKNKNSNWIIADVWYTTNTGGTIEQIEEDNRIIKLSFPLLTTTKWNANIYNTLGDQEYKYSELHTTKTFNSIVFDSTITVIQKPYSTNLVNTSNAFEIYANGIGLVSKKYIYLYKNLIDTLEYTNYTYTIESFGK